MSNIRVQWSEKESVIDVPNVDELEHALADIEANVSPEYPIIVFVDTNGYRVSLGLGHVESFVQFEQESGDPPYFVTVGDNSAKGALTFYLFGSHHTEIPRRNLISAVKAREVLYEWIQTAVRPANMKWEEV
jgi:hypothetical protein